MVTRDHRPGSQHSRSIPERERGEEIGRHLNALSELRDAVNACRRCPLYRDATQGVPGEGPQKSDLMLVGEQPGDAEDLEGHPFVGPAGAILDRGPNRHGVGSARTAHPVH
jgi:DNA polymerase